MALSRLEAPWRPLRVAMVGQKGLPARYGGIEHHVEEFGQRLAERGHDVVVYSRRSYGELPDLPYLGMDVRKAPTIPSKHLDAIMHSFSSTFLALVHGCDVVHYHALGPGIAAPVPRYSSRAGVVLTVHGLDHEREKWGAAARSVLGLAHWMSARVPDETVVVSRSLREHYLTQFGKKVSYIPNGATEGKPATADALAGLGLEPQGYVLFVGRFVPEKSPHVLLEAYRTVDNPHKLVLVGDSSFTDCFTKELHRLAERDSRVILTGFLYGDKLRSLYQHARLFVQPSVVEGLPLTLLEAISYSLPILASDIDPHREVLGASALGHELFRAGDVNSLRTALERALGAAVPPAGELRRFRDSVLDEYSWERALDELEQVYLRVAPPARSKHVQIGPPPR